MIYKTDRITVIAVEGELTPNKTVILYRNGGNVELPNQGLFTYHKTEKDAYMHIREHCLNTIENLDPKQDVTLVREFNKKLKDVESKIANLND